MPQVHITYIGTYDARQVPGEIISIAIEDKPGFRLPGKKHNDGCLRTMVRAMSDEDIENLEAGMLVVDLPGKSLKQGVSPKLRMASIGMTKEEDRTVEQQFEYEQASRLMSDAVITYRS